MTVDLPVRSPTKSEHPDNFYRPVAGELLWVQNEVHGPEATNQDTGGKFVLGFFPSWRFGAHGPLMPSDFDLRMVGGRQGERVAELTEPEWKRLRQWLDENSAELTSLPQSSKRCSPSKKPAEVWVPVRRRSKC
jgi:hypothetical protein